MRSQVRFALVFSAFLIGQHVQSALPVAEVQRTGEVGFEREVAPFLNDNCLACHCKTTTKGGLNLETRELMLKGGDTGPALVPGNAAKSLLFTAATHTDPDTAMPPRDNKAKAKNLNAAQLGVLKLWIEQGAKVSPRSERVVRFQPLAPHLKAIVAAVVSADGQYAACARANRLYVYHVPTGACVLEDASEKDQISSLAFSPDGKMLAVGGFRQVKLWRHASETTLSPASVTEDLVAQTRVQSERLVVVAEGTLAVSGSLTASPPVQWRHGSKLSAWAMREDGRRIATAGEDGSVKLWDETGKLLGTQKGSRVLNEAVLEKDRGLQVELSNLTLAKTGVTDAEKFVKAAEDRIKKTQTDLDAKRKEGEAKDTALKTLREAKAAGGEKAPTDQAMNAAEEAAQKAAVALKTAETEVGLAKAESVKGAADLKQAQAELARQEGVKNRAEQALADAKRVAAQSVRPMLRLVFSGESRLLVGQDASGVCYSWSANNGLPVGVFDAGVAESGEPVFSFGKGDVLWVGVKGHEAAWDLSCKWSLERQIGASVGRSPLADRVYALAFSPDGKTLATGGGEPSREGEIRVWNIETGALKRAISKAHSDTVFALEFSPDGKMLASGGADKMARLLDLATGKVIRTMEGHTGHVLSLDWSADGRQLVTAGADNVAKVWDAATGQRKRNVDGYEKEVTGVRFVGVNGTVATSSGDSKVRLVGADGKEIRVFEQVTDFMQALALRRDGSQLVSGGQDGMLRVWTTETGKVEASFAP